MKTVIIESPYAGDVKTHTEYAKRALMDSLCRGEAPFASHLLYTQVLDDTDPEERKMGIEAGLALGAFVDATVVYKDYGITPGMEEGIQRAYLSGRPIVYRSIGKNR